MQGHLQIAFSYVTGAWIPVNPAVGTLIAGRAREGVYAAQPDLFLEDLKSDPALYATVLNELWRSRRLNGKGPASALRELARAGKVGRLLPGPGVASQHSFDSLTISRAERLYSTLMSAAVSERLAKAEGLDGDEAFCSAILRQLGLTLVAWNYPAVFDAALEAGTSESAAFERTLDSQLGFSPLMLGAALAWQWQLPKAIQGAVGHAHPSLRLTKSELEQGERLAALCRVGETLARAACGEGGRPSEPAVERARAAVERSLGSEGMKILGEQVRHYTRLLVDREPHLTRIDPVGAIRPSSSSSSTAPAPTRQPNRYLERCVPALRTSLETLYRGIESSALHRDSIEHLTTCAVPSAGFTAGAIYLYDPAEAVLVPRLAFGSWRLKDVPRVKAASSAQHVVASAFLSRAPVCLHEELVSGKHIRQIAGVLGAEQRLGVLWLYLGDELARDMDANPLLYFKAIRQACDDCLDIF